jgi:hypothetical protein
MTLADEFGEIDFLNDEGRGVDNLPDFLRNSPKFVDIIEAFIPEIQELHDAQRDVFLNINIYDAEGSQLDNIFGDLLDLERLPGQSDDDYRLDIIAQAAKLSKSGGILTMKRLYRSLLNASSVRLFEYQPATFKLEATVDAIPTESQLLKIRGTLRAAKQGGNEMALSVNDKPGFILSDGNPQTNSPNGLTDGTFQGGTLSIQF